MAFTSTWTTIAASQADANSPLDTVLLEGIRQDLIYLYEYIGGQTYTPSTSHNHNGINSAVITNLSTNLVGETHIDWTNAGGISQIVMGTSTVLDFVSSTSFSTTSQITLYVPANATAFEYKGYGINNVAGSGEGALRLQVGAVNGSSAQLTATALGWGSTGSIDVSTMSGWTNFDISMKANSGSNLALHRLAGRFR